MEDLYGHLDPTRREIRLLHINPGSWDENIECRLKTVSLATSPGYQALSYVWGDEAHRRQILLQGYPFGITINLWCALRRLRNASDTRVIWIDATCINQADISERTAQVELMSEIYSSSSEILIWLGDFLPNDSDLLRPSCKTVEDGKSLEWIAENVQSIIRQKNFVDHESEILGAFGMLYLLSRDEHWSSKGPFIPNREARLCIAKECIGAWKALIKIVQLPWWSRVWVVQEVLLAKTATLALGSSSAPWSLITQFTISYINHLPPAACCYVSVTWRMVPELWSEFVQLRLPFSNFFTAQEELVKYESRRPQIRLWNFLWRIRHKNTTDPRDKVFGILGLEGSLLKPDYALGVAETFTKCMQSIMKGESNLNFLCGPRLRREGLPTWVVDLLPHDGAENILFFHNVVLRITSLPFSADGGRMAQFSFEANKLILYGTLVDVIKDMSPRREEGREADAVQRWETLARVHETNIYPSGCVRTEAFWRTLIRDVIKVYEENENSRRATVDEYPSYQVFRRWLAGNSSNTDDENQAFLIFRKSFFIATQDLDFFITENGYFGFGAAPKEGDQIWIFAGGRVPFILRQYPENSEHVGKFMLIGDCYVHGIMDGEALEDDWEEHAKRVVLV